MNKTTYIDKPSLLDRRIIHKYVFIFFFLIYHVLYIAQADSTNKQILQSEPCGDIITFNNESTVKAKILKLTDTEVIYKRCANLNGPTITILIRDISRIKYRTDSVVRYNYTVYRTNLKIKNRDTTVTLSRQKNAIYATIGLVSFGGEAATGNLNYERHLFYLSKNKNACFLVRACFGTMLSLEGPAKMFMLVPNLVLGKKNSHFELGLGASVFIDDYDKSIFIPRFPAFNIGYRYQSPEGPFLFRTGIGLEGFYLSFGAAFLKSKKK